ncbi:hypothetical protein WAB73_003296 [Salmonella enterica subsp. enterica]
MDYETYNEIVEHFRRALERRGKLDSVMDVYNSPEDFTPVITIANRCKLSPMAAACLWSIERCISTRPSMRMTFDGRWSVAQCWAKLSDKTGHKDNINQHRFTRWTKMTDDWDTFYCRTQEFLKLCKLNGFVFSRRSLYEAIKCRDTTQKKYEDGSYLKMPKTEFFNIAMMIEFTQESKLC